MTEETASVEASNPLLGRVKVSGATVHTIVLILSFAASCMIAWVLWIHHVQAGEEKVTAKENVEVIAKALRESNRLVAETLEKSNAQNIKAMERLYNVTSEVACMADPTMRNRQDAREACRRIVMREGRW